jgi:hypothetical protein
MLTACSPRASDSQMAFSPLLSTHLCPSVFPQPILPISATSVMGSMTEHLVYCREENRQVKKQVKSHMGQKEMNSPDIKRP